MLCFADYYGLSSKKRDLRWERGNNLLGNGEQGKCCRKRDEKGENDRRCHRPAVLLLQRAREEEDGEEATEMVQMIKKKKKIWLYKSSGWKRYWINLLVLSSHELGIGKRIWNGTLSVYITKPLTQFFISLLIKQFRWKEILGLQGGKKEKKKSMRWKNPESLGEYVEQTLIPSPCWWEMITEVKKGCQRAVSSPTLNHQAVESYYPHPTCLIPIAPVYLSTSLLWKRLM